MTPQARAARPVDPAEAHRHARDGGRGQPLLPGQDQASAEPVGSGRRRLVHPLAGVLAVHRGARGVEQAGGRARRGLEGLQQVAETVHVGGAVGRFVACVGRHGVHHGVAPGRQRAQGRGGGEVQGQGRDAGGQPGRTPPQAEHARAVRHELDAEGRAHVAGAGDQDAQGPLDSASLNAETLTPATLNRSGASPRPPRPGSPAPRVRAGGAPGA